MKISDKLVALRKTKGLTQQQLAEKITYSDKVISKWEKGHSIPDIQALTSLANFYGLTLDELISDCKSGEQKRPFPVLPKIFFHTILFLCSFIVLLSIIMLFYPSNGRNFILATTWDSIVPLVLSFMLLTS